MRATRLPILVSAACWPAPWPARSPSSSSLWRPTTDWSSNPYARELWAEVVTPGGQTLTLPAYYADGGLFAVRARPDELGAYRFGKVSETTLGIHGRGPHRQPRLARRGPEHRQDPPAGNPARSRGIPASSSAPTAIPSSPSARTWRGPRTTGADRLGYYLGALPAFAHANLNWMRVWMAHWGGLNLDWLPAGHGTVARSPAASTSGSPKPGTSSSPPPRRTGSTSRSSSSTTASSTPTNDSNWAENPWNAANPGRIPQVARRLLHGPERPGLHAGQVPLHRRPLGLVARRGRVGALQRGALDGRVQAGPRGGRRPLARRDGRVHPVGRRLRAPRHHQHREPAQPHLREDGFLPAAPLRGQPDRGGAQLRARPATRSTGPSSTARRATTTSRCRPRSRSPA